GEKWGKRRKIIENSLTSNPMEKNLQVFTPTFINDLFSIWRLHSIIDLREHISCVALDIASTILLGYEISAVSDLGYDEEEPRTPRSIKVMHTINANIGKRFGIDGWAAWWVCRNEGESSEDLLKMHALTALERKMRERRIEQLGTSKAKEAGFVKPRENKKFGKVVLDDILESGAWIDEVFTNITLIVEQNAKIDLEDEMTDISDEIIALTMAFTEKITHTVVAAILEIAQNEEVYMSLLKELDTDVKQDLSKLSYLEKIINETLRLHPTYPFVARESTRKIELGGYKFEKGTRVLVNIAALHSNGWGNHAEAFMPERWQEKNSEKICFVPFGDGPMACPAKCLALSCIKILLTSILRSFKIQIVEGQEVLKKDGWTYSYGNVMVQVSERIADK
ncbi:hypothetical protein HK096_000427, partial [Nowakowskiella sp. JEL0078]